MLDFNSRLDLKLSNTLKHFRQTAKSEIIGLLLVYQMRLEVVSGNQGGHMVKKTWDAGDPSVITQFSNSN